MIFLKKLLHTLLFLPIPIVLMLIPFATAMLLYAFLYEDANPIAVYASYFLSAYTLTVACIQAPRLIRKIAAFKRENKYVSLYTSDAHLRIKLSLYGTVAMNTLYALMQLFSGFYFHSVWFYALAGYYALLAVMRFFLLRDTLRVQPGTALIPEYKRYRFCGIMLLLMNLTLAVIVFYIVRQNRGFEYHYIHTIALAAYTFTLMAMAIKNVIKYRRFGSPVMSAAKAISLASALVSMLSLETAMLTAFGEENTPEFRQIMTASTGGGVCVIVLTMAVYMIIRSTFAIKRLKINKTQT